MKNLLLFLLLIPIQLISQTRYISMTNDNGKVVTIKENKRVKITTVKGHFYFGKVKIINER